MPTLDQDLQDAPPQLDYATPAERNARYPELQFLARIVPRVAYAIGAAMVMGGLGMALSRDGEPALLMGVGAGIMALARPWPGRQTR